jgi:hypothetical protein
LRFAAIPAFRRALALRSWLLPGSTASRQAGAGSGLRGARTTERPLDTELDTIIDALGTADDNHDSDDRVEIVTGADPAIRGAPRSRRRAAPGWMTSSFAAETELPLTR